MSEKIPVDESILDATIDSCENLGAKYADIRITTQTSEGTMAENGNIKRVAVDDSTQVGIRALAGGTWGFHSLEISNPSDLEEGLSKCARKAVKAAKAAKKNRKIELADVEPVQETVQADMKKKPIPIDEKKVMVQNISKRMMDIEHITMARFSLSHEDITSYFWSSEGSAIIQDIMIIEGGVYVVASSDKDTQAVWIPFGARGGWEYIEKIKPLAFALNTAKLTKKLATIAVTPKTDNTTVVTRPTFNSLQVHEIVGHPVEGDRVLGGESAWAGRAWWAKKSGKNIGSKLVTAVSDARPMDRHAGLFGTFNYDDEGVPAKRVVHIEKGQLKGFLHSRQTAAIADAEPSGAMRSIHAGVMPIIRMTNTYFESNPDGPSNLGEMIEDIKEGVILGHQSIPSIGSLRYRWQINAYDGWEIKNGKIGRMYKNLAILGNTPDFLGSVFQVGNEKTFELKQIPNCGKGDPMQIMRLANGGPIMAGKARLMGGA